MNSRQALLLARVPCIGPSYSYRILYRAMAGHGAAVHQSFAPESMPSGLDAILTGLTPDRTHARRRSPVTSAI
jgi:hypothetical protein